MRAAEANHTAGGLHQERVDPEHGGRWEEDEAVVAALGADGEGDGVVAADEERRQTGDEGVVVLEEDALLARHEHRRVVRAEVVAAQVENPLFDAHRACGVEGVEGVVSGDLHGLDGVDGGRGVGEGGFGRGLVEAVDGEREQAALALWREEADEGVGALEELSGGDVG